MQILVPQLGIEPKLPALEDGVATTGLPGKSQELNFCFISFWFAGFFCRCTRAFFSYGEQGLLLVAVPGLLIAVASLFAEHRLQGHGLQQLTLHGSRVWAW